MVDVAGIAYWWFSPDTSVCFAPIKVTAKIIFSKVGLETRILYILTVTNGYFYVKKNSNRK
jgi:hypothetical protein